MSKMEITPMRALKKQSFKQKLTMKIAFISLGVIAVLVGTILYWSFADEKVLTVNNEPFPVRTIREHPMANGVVILKVDFCKHYDIEGDLRISFLNTDHEVFLPIVKERSPKECKVTEFPILIPEVIEPGKYRVKFRATYDINPVKRNITSEFVSRDFEIAPEVVN